MSSLPVVRFDRGDGRIWTYGWTHTSTEVEAVEHKNERHKPYQDRKQRAAAVIVAEHTVKADFTTMKASPTNRDKYSFEKRWAPSLKDDGWVPVSTFFLENYHRLKPFDLTYGEAMFLVHLMQHKWDENAPFPAYKTISNRMHVSAKSARRWAASLEQKGYLKREMRVGETNRFHLKGLMDALVRLKDSQAKKVRKKPKASA